MHAIIYDLPKRIQLTQTKSNNHFRIVKSILSLPLHSSTAEAESLISQIVTALHIIKDVFIILTSRLTNNEIEFPAMTRIEIHAKK